MINIFLAYTMHFNQPLRSFCNARRANYMTKQHILQRHAKVLVKKKKKNPSNIHQVLPQQQENKCLCFYFSKMHSINKRSWVRSFLSSISSNAGISKIPRQGKVQISMVQGLNYRMRTGDTKFKFGFGHENLQSDIQPVILFRSTYLAGWLDCWW